MRYALTFTNPETYDWNETDTIILETPKNPLDISLDTLAGVLAEKANYDYDKSEWSDILANDSWYVRNCEDADVDLWGVENV